MSGPHTWPGSPLTDGQEDQLKALHRAGALTRESAVGPHDKAFRRAKCGCNPNILGALRSKNLAKSRVIRAGAHGGQHTAYWLTPLGIDAVAQLLGPAS